MKTPFVIQKLKDDVFFSCKQSNCTKKVLIVELFDL